MDKPDKEKTIDPQMIRKNIVEQLSTIFDPEIPINIYDLGLIYEIDVKDNGTVDILMTFTSPACPIVDALLNEVNYKASSVKGVTYVIVNITWDPPWSKEKASERAQLELEQLFGI